MQGQFSAYVNIHTGVVTIAKSPNEFEYENNTHYSPICREKVRKEVMNHVEEYFEINYVPEEQRIIVV